MRSRRAVLFGLGGFLLAGGGFLTGGFRETRLRASARLQGISTVMETSVGPLEYAIAGDGAPLMMIHGTGGGYDQGLLLAGKLMRNGFRILSPSRFGYLGSAFPEDPSPARQADVLAEWLDALRIDRLPVLGGSAGALTAAEFALRHPDRCSHLGLLVPAANLTNRDPVEFTALQQIAVDTVLASDFAFWALSRAAPYLVMRTLLATDPALLQTVSPEEVQRARTILAQLFPVSEKQEGLRNDGFWSGSPSQTAFQGIACPTLILSSEDDLFGTAETARLMADRIPGAELVIFSDGGHIWLGRDTEVADTVSDFIRRTGG